MVEVIGIHAAQIHTWTVARQPAREPDSQFGSLASPRAIVAHFWFAAYQSPAIT